MDLPKGITQETYDMAAAIVRSGFTANQPPDVIKTAMFEKGIPFSQLLRLYKAITISERLVVPPAEIKAGIETLFDLIDFTVITEYEHIQQIVNKALETIEGATERGVTQAIRKKMSGMDLACPKKPRALKTSHTRVSKIHVAITDLFSANTNATLEEFKTALEEVTTEKSALRWSRLYKLFSALATHTGMVQHKDSQDSPT